MRRNVANRAARQWSKGWSVKRALMQEQKASRPRKPFRLGALLARGLLALLFVSGLFFSVVPLGRAAARSALLLPALITQSEPPPLVLVGDPVRHTESTLASQ